MTTTTTTNEVTAIVNVLRRAALAYHCGEITHTELGNRNHVCWDFAREVGIVEEVKEALRLAEAEEIAYARYCDAEEARLEYR